MTRQKITSAVGIPRIMLHATGLWPDETPTLWYRLKRVISILTGLFFGFIMTLEIYLSYGDLLRVSDTILKDLLAYVTILKVLVICCNHDKLLKLVNELEDPLLHDYEERHEKHVKRVVRMSNLFCRGFVTNSALLVLFTTLSPILDRPILPVQFNMIDNKFIFYVVYFMEMFAAYTAIWNQSSIDMLLIGLINIAIGELDILLDKLQQFGDENFMAFDMESAALEYLSVCAIFHNKLILIVNSIDDIFSFSLLAQFVATILVLCNCGFQLTSVSIFSTQFYVMFVLFVWTMTEIFMFCWLGDEIMTKSSNIGNACYMSKWYNYGPRVGKVFFIIMERSKTPLTISIYKFSDLTLETFRGIMSRSFSYFTVLRQLYEQ